MKANRRLDQIVQSVDEHGYITVSDLSRQFGVSEMTIRRDLDKLAKASRLQRTYGGAATAHLNQSNKLRQMDRMPARGLLDCQADVLIAASLNPKLGLLLQDSDKSSRLPLISEALPQQNARTCVSIDDYQGAVALGRWAGGYAQEHWNGVAKVLDLTYHFSNTQARSRGFLAGLQEVLPTAVDVLSLNPDPRYDLVYQLTHDALTVDRSFNIIFCINDTNAIGAMQACSDLRIDPADTIVLSCGLEGNTLRQALVSGGYYKAGLAMFPEIVGPACIQAAVAAYHRLTLPERIYTPSRVLDQANLGKYYSLTDTGWSLKAEAYKELAVLQKIPSPLEHRPFCIGVILPFGEHEWYQNLIVAMRAYAQLRGIHIEILDVEQTLRSEIELRQRDIARRAAELIEPNDVILLDGGAITQQLAQLLVNRSELTIITNSMPVFDILKNCADITLISTGGVLRKSSQSLVGPTAEKSLQELRADKLFLSVSGVSLDFGLSHTNISEVTIKQTMLRSAREVILLADYTTFGEESMIQIAPLSVIHKLVSDNALAASLRLNLNRLGIQVVVAS